MITGINESKTLRKHISCECECRFDGKNVIQNNGGIMINVSILSMIITVRAIFFENNKYHLQVFLNECLYKL